jgi:hypothetical protein
MTVWSWLKGTLARYRGTSGSPSLEPRTVVDDFEDALALRLGLHRHPSCAETDWRRIRERYLNLKSVENERPIASQGQS